MKQCFLVQSSGVEHLNPVWNSIQKKKEVMCIAHREALVEISVQQNWGEMWSRLEQCQAVSISVAMCRAVQCWEEVRSSGKGSYPKKKSAPIWTLSKLP